MTSRHKIYQQQSRKSVQMKRDSHSETLTPKETLRERERTPKTQSILVMNKIGYE